MRRAIVFALMAGALLVLGAATPWTQASRPQIQPRGARPRMRREPVGGGQR